MDRLLQVVEICLPLFALIGLGAWLRVRGILHAAALEFLTWLVYWFSLPILIFFGVARQPFAELMDAAVIGSTLGATAVGLLVGMGLRRVAPEGLRGAVTVAPFFANVAYLGFPLAQNAFGAPGLTTAGIVNAFTMPVFVSLGVLALGRDPVSVDEGGPPRALWRTVAGNPIILAAAGGVAVSLVFGAWAPGVAVASRPWLAGAAGLVVAVCEPLGTVGLPLALLSVGANLRWRTEGPAAPTGLLVGLAGIKLLLAPALTWGLCRLLFPEAAAAKVGTAVLLMACPTSVGFFVIARGRADRSAFVATLLALTTLGSCVTLPCWVWWVIG